MDTATTLLRRRAEDGLELPVLAVVDGLSGDMVAHGAGELDHSAVIAARSAAGTA